MKNSKFAYPAVNSAFNSMNSSLLKASLLIAVVLTLMSSSGCRNCRNTCGQPFAANGYNGVPGYGVAGYGAPSASVASNSPTIAPPPTYSLNIPGGGANPYAQGGTRVGQLPSGLLNTRQAAPTSASGSNSPANFNQQQGWRQINGANLNTQSSTTSAPNAGGQVATSVLDRSIDRTAARAPQVNAQTIPARSTGMAAATTPANRPQFNNVATTRSTDYRTTSVDERQDATRLPVTDASAMQSRVAQNFAQPPTQPYYNRQQGNQQFQQPRFAANTLPQHAGYQGQFLQPVNMAYQGQFSNPVGRVGGQFASPMSQPQLVQSQSTATYDPYNSTASDWRNRGRDSRSY